MNFTKLAFILVVGTFMSVLVRAEKIGIKQHQQLHQTFVDSGFSGTVIITQNGSPVFHQGYGMAVREWQIANSTNTKFRIGSLSKTFTEVVIMKLAEEGQLDIDEPLKRYLPDYPANYGNEVTLLHLLTHRSGIPRLFNIPGWTNGKSVSPHTKESFISMIADMPVAFNAGLKRQYSSANYYLLGAVIEQVTGQSFGQVLQDKILKPLNMKNTDVYRPGQLVLGLASPYKSVAGKYSFCPDVEGEFCSGGNVNLTLFMASGSMHSTTEDLTLWAQAIDGKDLLRESSKTFLFNPKTQTSWNVQTVDLSNKQNLKLLVADGGLEGNSSMLIKLPEEQITIVMLNNTGMEYQNKAELGLKILDIMLE